MAERPSVFPSIIPNDDDSEFVDDSYTHDELQRMDGNTLQSIAAQHPTEEVNGRSKASEIRDVLEGRERVEVDDE